MQSEPPRRNPRTQLPAWFGRYLLCERVATGGMAEVYLSRKFGEHGFERFLAVKRILPGLESEEGFIAMFIDEAKIAGQLTHPNICPIHELGRVGSSHYMAMEYVWGKDLLQIINRHRALGTTMDPSMAAWIASGICQALNYAHKRKDAKGNPLNIIHRDISPQNILVDYDGQVHLIDFGIARAASRSTRTRAGVLKGKVSYMSPEQLEDGPLDQRSDLFPVGTCLWEMLCSERLFRGEGELATMEEVRSGRIPSPTLLDPRVPEELDNIVLKALVRERDNRYQEAAEMAADLNQFLNTTGQNAVGGRTLAHWMQTAFQKEYHQEQQKLEHYLALDPSTVTHSARTPEMGTHPVADESTQIFFHTSEDPPPHSNTATPRKGRSSKRSPSMPDPRVLYRLTKSVGLRKHMWAIVVASGLLVGAVLGTSLAPTSGDLIIKSFPVTGAIVHVDGVQRGKTPLKLQGISSGERRVTVHLTGYTQGAKQVSISPKKPQELIFDLIPLGQATQDPP